jgi:hypothetical protein
MEKILPCRGEEKRGIENAPKTPLCNSFAERISFYTPLHPPSRGESSAPFSRALKMRLKSEKRRHMRLPHNPLFESKKEAKRSSFSGKKSNQKILEKSFFFIFLKWHRFFFQ